MSENIRRNICKCLQPISCSVAEPTDKKPETHENGNCPNICIKTPFIQRILRINWFENHMNNINIHAQFIKFCNNRLSLLEILIKKIYNTTKAYISNPLNRNSRTILYHSTRDTRKTAYHLTSENICCKA